MAVRHDLSPSDKATGSITAFSIHETAPRVESRHCRAGRRRNYLANAPLSLLLSLYTAYLLPILASTQNVPFFAYVLRFPSSLVQHVISRPLYHKWAGDRWDVHILEVKKKEASWLCPSHRMLVLQAYAALTVKHG